MQNIIIFFAFELLTVRLTFAAPPSYGGCSILPSDNVFNTAVDQLPVHPHSVDFMDIIISGASAVHPDFGAPYWDPYSTPPRFVPEGIPINVVPQNQPFVTLDLSHNAYGSQGYYAESDLGPGGSGSSARYPIPAFAQIEGGVNASHDSDRHLLIIQQNSTGDCTLWEAWQANYTDRKHGTGWTATNGALWHLGQNYERPLGWTSADAAGLPIMPGLVRWDEVNNDSIAEINHAFRFTIPSGFIYGYWWPGSHVTNPASNTAGCTNVLNKYVPAAHHCPGFGQRFRLKASYNELNWNLTYNGNFYSGAFSSRNSKVVRALKKYGLILADGGSSLYISGESSNNWDGDEQSLKYIESKYFEAVDDSCMEVDQNSLKADLSQCAGIVPTTAQPTTLHPTSHSPTTHIPTHGPSFSPSKRPTARPSLKPSKSPSASPRSLKPSLSPSHAPSRRPTTTRSPSASPSHRPTTLKPTFQPSVSPSSARPSSSPSKKPTSARPTFSPSHAPSTARPSSSPTSRPTTAHPTLSPSHAPSTARPSSSPTSRPTTVRPTLLPSRSPLTARPSSSPTSRPTTVRPTQSPSRSPLTARPSSSPTSRPTTLHPTFSPSRSPLTARPSSSPTSRPTTLHPTFSPSRSPLTVRPSSSPTSRPTTLHPTFSPSRSPLTARPSSSPTSRPTTAHPSFSPSHSPSTAHPSRSPSRRPSLTPVTSKPTLSPSTSRPSRSPSSARPSRSPSRKPTLTPVVSKPTFAPTHAKPTLSPSTSKPSKSPSTAKPSHSPTHHPSTTGKPSHSPTHHPSTTAKPTTTSKPTTSSPTSTNSPTTTSPTVSPSRKPTDSSSSPTHLPTSNPLPISPFPTSAPIPQPVIVVTSFPPFNASSPTNIVGNVVNGIAGQIVAAYVYTDAYWNKAHATLSGSLTFSLNVNSAPSDRLGSVLGLILLAAGSTVPTCNDVSSVCATLPPSLASWQTARGPLAFSFANRVWMVKNFPTTRVGPNNNYFLPSNVQLHTNSLSLSATFDPSSSNWYASEVQLVDSLGYGTYIFRVNGGNTSNLDSALTFGLFTWDDFAPSPYREIDFELGRWQEPLDVTNAQFVIQPFTIVGNLKRFTLPPGDVTLAMRWEFQAISFAVFQGFPCLNASTLVAESGLAIPVTTWTYTGTGVPVPGTEKVHLNLWLNGVPVAQTNSTVSLADFEFSSGDQQLCPATLQAGSIVPLYSYPPWPSVVSTLQAQPRVPLVLVINPNSGPGSSVDANYVSGIAALQAAGGIVIGYVHTTYGNRNLADVLTDMTLYTNFYPTLDGLFVDEMAASTGMEQYYANLSSLARGLGFAFLVGNPGTEPDPSYFEVGMDTLIVYENAFLPDDLPNGIAKARAVIAYNVTEWNQTWWMDEGLNRLGWIYATDQTYPVNPYADLPSYWDQMIQGLVLS